MCCPACHKLLSPITGLSTFKIFFLILTLPCTRAYFSWRTNYTIVKFEQGNYVCINQLIETKTRTKQPLQQRTNSN